MVIAPSGWRDWPKRKVHYEYVVDLRDLRAPFWDLVLLRFRYCALRDVTTPVRPRIHAARAEVGNLRGSLTLGLERVSTGDVSSLVGKSATLRRRQSLDPRFGSQLVPPLRLPR